ncbi:hypothetical protein OIU77_023262 [Salix suchowensis]|uniref:Uncharacterized protein n=1 Tax=Salix suchowensis TaxID=1278906 RepID=A0ABQ9C377_9ROSI|nr:hypothetical protein OIU77_023262 [Salix suchowensis]
MLLSKARSSGQAQTTAFCFTKSLKASKDFTELAGNPCLNLAPSKAALLLTSSSANRLSIPLIISSFLIICERSSEIMRPILRCFTISLRIIIPLPPTLLSKSRGISSFSVSALGSAPSENPGGGPGLPEPGWITQINGRFNASKALAKCRFSSISGPTSLPNDTYTAEPGGFESNHDTTSSSVTFDRRPARISRS